MWRTTTALSGEVLVSNYVAFILYDLIQYLDNNITEHT